MWLITFSCQYASHSSSGTSSKRAWPRDADVVDEAVEPAERRRRGLDDALGLARRAEIGLRRATPRRPPAPRSGPQVTTRAPSSASSRAVSSPMPAVEPVTRHTLVAEAEIHRPLAYPAMTTILLARHGETDWNRRAALCRATPTRR